MRIIDFYKKLPLFQIKSFLSNKSKNRIFLLMVLIVIGAISELTLLASLYPVIWKITSGDSINNATFNNSVGFFSQFYSLSINNLVIIFLLIIIVSSLLRITLLWLSGIFSAIIGHEISILLYKKTLNLPYENHLTKNSSDSISELSLFVDQLMRSVQYNITLFSSIIYMIGMFSGLLVIDTKVAIYSALIFGSAYILIGKFAKYKLEKNGKLNLLDIEKRIRSIQESIGSIREIIINNSQNFYTFNYSKLDLPIRYRNAENALIASLPRYLLEAIGMICISLFILFSSSQKGFINSLPIIGVFALGSQKIIPSFQLMYASWAGIISYEPSTKKIINSLNNKEKNFYSKPTKSSKKNLVFKSLLLEDVAYKYINSTKNSLDSINLEIMAGEHIGIIGKTGSGKTTLLDIILGLLNPTKGKFLVNGKSLGGSNYGIIDWRKTLSHVPQNIYISDSSVASNIALSKNPSKIDFKMIRHVCDLANISEFIKSLPDGYFTKLGERGSRLSGGQKQRIGIARALYQKSSIVVFDEATSALDTITEKKILDSLNYLTPSITMITVAHRFSAVERCDKIIKLKNGFIEKIGSPSEFT